MTIYFGFAISDAMFNSDVTINREEIPLSSVKDCFINNQISVCLNPSHQATIDAMKDRFDIEVAIPKVAPKVSLVPGDTLIIMQVRGLPRLDATRHEYTKDDINKATFTFSEWKVYSFSGTKSY